MDGRPYPQAPVLDTAVAIVAALVNIVFWPGLGTIIGSVVAGERGVGKGIAQFLLTIIIVGWVWAVVTAVQMLVNSSWRSKQA